MTDLLQSDKTSTNISLYQPPTSLSSTINQITPQGGTLTVSGTLTATSLQGSLTGNVTGTATDFNNGTSFSSDGTVTATNFAGNLSATTTTIKNLQFTAQGQQIKDKDGNNVLQADTASSQNILGNASHTSIVTGSSVNLNGSTIGLGTLVTSPTINTGSGGSGGTINATTVNANLTGNVTGNVTGSSGSCTGNAATATTATNFNNGTSSSSGGTVTATTFSGNLSGNLTSGTTTMNNLQFNSGTKTVTDSTGAIVLSSGGSGGAANTISNTSRITNVRGSTVNLTTTGTLNADASTINLGNNTTNPTINTGSGGSGGAINASTVTTTTLAYGGGLNYCSLAFGVVPTFGNTSISSKILGYPNIKIGDNTSFLINQNYKNTFSGVTSIAIPFNTNAYTPAGTDLSVSNPVCRIQFAATSVTDPCYFPIGDTSVGAPTQLLYTSGLTSTTVAIPAISTSQTYLYGNGGTLGCYGPGGVTSTIDLHYTGATFVVDGNPQINVSCSTVGIVSGLNYGVQTTAFCMSSSKTLTIYCKDIFGAAINMSGSYTITYI